MGEIMLIEIKANVTPILFPNFRSKCNLILKTVNLIHMNVLPIYLWKDVI